MGDHAAGGDLPSGTVQAGAQGLRPALETKAGRQGWEYSGFRGEEVELQFSKGNLKKIKATKSLRRDGNFDRRFSWTGSDSSFLRERH